MTYIRYNKLSGSDCDNIVSKKDKMQDKNRIQIKVEVHDTYEKIKN